MMSLSSTLAAMLWKLSSLQGLTGCMLHIFFKLHLQGFFSKIKFHLFFQLDITAFDFIKNVWDKYLLWWLDTHIMTIWPSSLKWYSITYYNQRGLFRYWSAILCRGTFRIMVSTGNGIGNLGSTPWGSSTPWGRRIHAFPFTLISLGKAWICLFPQPAMDK